MPHDDLSEGRRAWANHFRMLRDWADIRRPSRVIRQWDWTNRRPMDIKIYYRRRQGMSSRYNFRRIPHIAVEVRNGIPQRLRWYNEQQRIFGYYNPVNNTGRIYLGNEPVQVDLEPASTIQYGPRTIRFRGYGSPRRIDFDEEEQDFSPK